MDKLDNTLYRTPAYKATQQGNSQRLNMAIVNKVNEIVDALGTVAVASTVATMNTQIAGILTAQNAFIDQFNAQLSALTNRVATLEIAPAEAISNINETLNISLGGVLNLGALNTTMTSQAQTINKILAVMRTRKEIKT